MKASRLFKIISAFMMTYLVTACGSGSTSGMNTSPNTTTVMVYMIGTNLETDGNAASSNIEQMLKLSDTSNLNIILETGGSKRDTNPLGINWSHVQRYQVKNGQLILLQDLGEDINIDMGKQSTLTDFLQWANESFSGDKRVLVLWDHGGGPNGGIGPDEHTGSILSVPDILGAIEASNTQYEIIGFDACLMASVEVAAGLQPYAQYMVASEDLEPGNGWDYTVWLGYLQGHPNANGAEIGRFIADGFKALNKNDVITLSVTDLSKVPTITAAMNNFASVLQPYTSQSVIAWEVIADARVRSLDFNTSSFFKNSGGATDVVDLGQLVSNIELGLRKNFVLDPVLLSASDAVYNALESSIVYKVSTSSNDTATGLTIYFPSVLAIYPDKNYESNLTFDGAVYFSTNYVTDLLPSYYGYYLTESTNLIAHVATESISNGEFNATITNDYNFVLVARGNGVCTVYAGNDPINAQCIKTMQNINYESHDPLTRSWSFNYDTSLNQWPTLQGEAVSLIPDFSVLKNLAAQGYLVPVSYKGDNDDEYLSGYLRVEAVDDAGKLVVKGFQPSSDQPGKTYNLDVGDTLAINYYVPLMDGSWAFFRSNREIVLESNSPEILITTSNPSAGDKLNYLVDDLTGKISVGTFR